MARSHHRDRQVSECLLQDLRPRGVRGSAELDSGGSAAVRRTRDRQLRLAPCALRERLAGLHPFGQLSTVGGGPAGNHPRGGRGQSKKVVLRQCGSRVPFELKRKLSLNCLGVLSHPWSESLARQQISVQTNWNAGGENL